MTRLVPVFQIRPSASALTGMADTALTFDPSSATDTGISFMRLPEVKAATGLSKSSIYALGRAKLFPEPVPLGLRMVAWVRSEVQAWAAERVRQRDAS